MLNRMRREHGQDLVEYALILPVLVVLLFGVVEFSLIIFTYNTVGDAAQVGARQGVITPTDCTRIRNQVYSVTDLARLARADLTIPCPTPSGGAIRVQVSYNYRSFTRLFDAFIGWPMVLRASATMVIE